MTSPSSGNGLVLTPNGGINIGATVGTSTPTASIWSLPRDIPAGQKSIWYDTQTVQVPDSYATSSTAAAEHGTNNPIAGTHPTSQRLLLTTEQMMSQIAALSARDPMQFAALQRGLSMWGTTEQGVWGPKTEGALSKAMSAWYQLSRTGTAVTFSQFLANASQQVASQEQARLQAQQPVVHLMDPAQIRDAAQNAAMQALGHGLSQDQLAKFVDQFHQEQMSKDSGDPFATNYKLPGEAMQFAQDSNPADFNQNQTQTYANAFINMFAPTQSQRPNMTPTPAA